MGLAVELFAAGHVPFPSGGLIQLASERVQLRPLRAGDQVRCRVELDRVDPHPKGLQITLVSRNWNASGQLCSQNTLRLLARQRGTAPVQRPRSAPSTTAADAGEWKELTRWKLRSNHGRRYARVSGDYNPIHLWSWSSRPFGYARPILQGCCTEALVAHALIHHLLNDEIAALRKLRIDFRSPLLLPSEVQLSIAMHPEETGGLFRVTDAQASERIFAEGSFVGRGASSGVHPAR